MYLGASVVPMCPGPRTIWTDRTMHRVPKRYHGAAHNRARRSGEPSTTEIVFHARATAPRKVLLCMEAAPFDTEWVMSEETGRRLRTVFGALALYRAQRPQGAED